MLCVEDIFLVVQNTDLYKSADNSEIYFSQYIYENDSFLCIFAMLIILDDIIIAISFTNK